MKPIDFLAKLFEARDVIHLLHLNTTSYAQHKALGEFYEGWVGLMDTFIETYQGRYTRISGKIGIDADSTTDCEEYLSELRDSIMKATEELIIKADIDLNNILADMLGLTNHTLYMLSLK